jgi:polyphosphate kinase 2 (PPK2 family)
MAACSSSASKALPRGRLETRLRRAHRLRAQLTGHGIIVLKFWLHLSKEEQLRRFRHREETDYKQHKINAEDWRNRRKWAAYETAVGDMLALTDRPAAPGTSCPPTTNASPASKSSRSCKQIATALEE